MYEKYEKKKFFKRCKKTNIKDTDMKKYFVIQNNYKLVTSGHKKLSRITKMNTTFMRI